MMKITILILALFIYSLANGQTTAEDYFKSGFESYIHAGYGSAVADFNRALKLNPNFVKAYEFRGWAKYELKDYIGAMADCNKAIQLGAEGVYILRGIVKSKLEDYRGAIEDYTKGIEFEPHNGNIYVLRGDAKSKLKDFKGAIEDYTKGIEFKSNEAYDNAFNAYSGRGNAKNELKDYRGAIEDYTKAIEESPNYGKGYFLRGLIKIAIGQKESGCLDLSKAGELGHEKAYDAIKELCN